MAELLVKAWTPCCRTEAMRTGTRGASSKLARLVLSLLSPPPSCAMSAPLRYISGKPKPAPSQRPHSIPTASTSRAPPQRGPPQPTGDEDRRVGEYWSIDDVCPVCKSDRYLTPDLRLLVSFCYHKM
jgi:hypothetical protein